MVKVLDLLKGLCGCGAVAVAVAAGLVGVTLVRERALWTGRERALCADLEEPWGTGAVGTLRRGFESAGLFAIGFAFLIAAPVRSVRFGMAMI